MITLKVGDEVRVFTRGYSTARGGEAPAESWTGTVTKVARKYATAVYEYTYSDALGGAGRSTGEIEFDVVTGRERYHRGNYAAYVKTPEQAEADRRETEALGALKAAGFEVRMGHHPSQALTIALAELARTFTGEG